MKKLSLVLLMVLLTFFAISTGILAEDEIQVAYMPPNLDEADFYGQFQAGLVEGLENRGIAFNMHSRAPATHDDHGQQLSIGDDMLSIGVDYIVLAPTSYEGQQNLYRNINDEGTPLIIANYNTPFPDDFNAHALTYVGYRHTDGGKATADYIKENYPEGTKIALIYGSPTQISYDRAAKELHEENGMEIVYEHYADWDRSAAFDATQRLLTSHPDVEVIIAASSYMAIGAVEAARSQNLLDEVDVFGAGGILEELENIMQGSLTATWFRDPREMGNNAAESIELHMQGKEEEIPEVYNAEIHMIDSVEDIIEYIDPVVFEAEGKEFPTLDN